MAQPRILERGPGYEQHIYDCTAKYLARDSGEWKTATGTMPRHQYFGPSLPADSGHYCESWRFPLVEAYSGNDLSPEDAVKWNEVTFVFKATPGQEFPSVVVVGLPFKELRRVPLKPVEDSLYLAATVVVPSGRVYRYAFVVNGVPQYDAINPQRVEASNGEVLSVFFTDYCFVPVTLEGWQSDILRRVTNHILPFNSHEAELFQLFPGGGSRQTLDAQLYRLDHASGVVNYIDKVLAREERHHLDAYRTCLAQINRILRSRNPYAEPKNMAESLYVELYDQMRTNQVPGWDYTLYSSPKYFLYLLRRHTVTGAFCHPKYGGNSGAVGWLWLSGQFPFDWDSALEKPLGKSWSYNG
jgi:hypothetical protein